MTIPLPQQRLRLLFGYIISIFAVATALLLSYVFWEFVSKAPFIFLLTGIVIGAWAGGLGSGVLATLLSIIGFNILLIMTPGRQFDDTESVFLLLVFASMGVAISYLQHSRLQAQQKLEALNGHLDTILDNIADGITSQIPTGKVIYANPKAAYLLGFETPQQLVNAPVEETINRYQYYNADGSVISRQELPNYKAVQLGVLQQGSFQIHDKVTNQRRWLLVKTMPFLDKKGVAQRMINVFQDITSDKEREANIAQINLLLNTHRTRLVNTLQNVPGIVWEGSKWGAKIEFVNDYAEQLLGYDKK